MQLRALQRTKSSLQVSQTIPKQATRDKAATSRSTALLLDVGLMVFACPCIKANLNISSSLLAITIDHNYIAKTIPWSMFAAEYSNGEISAIKRCGLLRLSGGGSASVEGLRLGSTFPPLSFHNNNLSALRIATAFCYHNRQHHSGKKRSLPRWCAL